MPTLYAGIDEAGYGPLLGPLCIGCAVFEVAGPAPECLWGALSAAVCRAPGDRRRRIAVDDSKKLKGARGAAGHPLRHLERGVVAFAGAAGERFATDDALLAHLGAPVCTSAPDAGPLPLPVGNEAAQLGIAAAMIGRTLGAAGVALHRLRVHALSPRDFNAQAERVGNKATINFMAAMQHVEAVRTLAAARGVPAHVALDQQGGRRSYMRPLATSFPDARVRVLEETDTCAAYELRFPGSAPRPGSAAAHEHTVTVRFEQGGEANHLPIALASMAAKFTRELHMRRLNAFFTMHMPELKPTAGYVEDGRRFLADIRPVVERLGLPESALVRAR